MLKRLGLLVAMAVAGCGGIPEPGSNGISAGTGGTTAPMCPPRQGLYVEHLVETNGTCGAIPDLTVDINGDAMPAAGCMYSATTTEFNCHVVETTTCAANANGATTTTTATVTFTPDNSVGSGTIYLRIGGTSTCASTYALKVTAIK